MKRALPPLGTLVAVLGDQERAAQALDATPALRMDMADPTLAETACAVDQILIHL